MAPPGENFWNYKFQFFPLGGASVFFRAMVAPPGGGFWNYFLTSLTVDRCRWSKFFDFWWWVIDDEIIDDSSSCHFLSFPVFSSFFPVFSSFFKFLHDYSCFPPPPFFRFFLWVTKCLYKKCHFGLELSRSSAFEHYTSSFYFDKQRKIFISILVVQ